LLNPLCRTEELTALNRPKTIDENDSTATNNRGPILGMKKTFSNWAGLSFKINESKHHIFVIAMDAKSKKLLPKEFAWKFRGIFHAKNFSNARI